jgi:hypothetical protein
MPYRFFFSYSREDYKASGFDRENWLDQFFDDLSKQVALLTGENIEEVAYRDIKRLRISDDWGSELIEAMQNSAVLVCVLSPHYLKSLPCGREVGLFHERLAQLKGQPGSDKHRIVPVFWVDQPYCHQAMHPHVKEFLETLQLTQEGLPEDYPLVGIMNSYGYGYHSKKRDACYSIRKHLAERIKELSDLAPLPKLANNADFNSLPSFFERRESAADERVAVGPLGTNVIYAVATHDMAGSVPAASTYADKPDEWRPFADKPNRTIGLLTQTALTDAGQRDTEYRAINLSEDLLVKIKKAREVNSPVLLVLDHTSLRVQTIKDYLAVYDSYDAPHIGLVTAGGTAADKPLLQKVFAAKYSHPRAHHLWTVPRTSDAYERSVADVVSALRADLQRFSQATIELQSSPMPSLTQPGT